MDSEIINMLLQFVLTYYKDVLTLLSTVAYCMSYVPTVRVRISAVRETNLYCTKYSATINYVDLVEQDTDCTNTAVPVLTVPASEQPEWEALLYLVAEMPTMQERGP